MMVRLAARGLLLLCLVACQREPAIRRHTSPPQRTLGELRTLYQEPIVDCTLPRVTPPADGVTLAAPDGGPRVRVPAGWSATPRIEIDTAVDTVRTAVWRHPLGHRISAMRESNGGSGPSWLQLGAQRLPGPPTCMVAAGDAGVIWRFFDPPPVDTGARAWLWNASGEVITADSLRFRFSVRAPTASARDSLAARITDAIVAR